DATRLLGVASAGYWTPSSMDVQRLESGLLPALELGVDRPERVDRYSNDRPPRKAFVARTIRHIIDRLDQYARQYIGIVDSHGARKVLVNCFPAPGSEAPPLSDAWRHQVISVLDGGSSYWRIQYDVASGQYEEFDVNGD